MVKVKICGITNEKDALAAQAAGCDAIGFVFYKKSARFIQPSLAKEIGRKLPASVHKVGVFVNAREKTIKKIAKQSGIDILQFHGNEAPDFCRRFKNYCVVKAFRVKGPVDWPSIRKYKTYGYLFDACANGLYGGTGRTLDWRLLKNASGAKTQIFLSGGLSRSNIKKAVASVKPDWVDVSSGVEARPGKKCLRKIRAFVRAVQSARASNR